MCCRTAGDRHHAFQAQSALSSKGITLGEEDLTEAHSKARQNKNQAVQQQLQQPTATPHLKDAHLGNSKTGQPVPDGAAARRQPTQHQQTSLADRPASAEDLTGQITELGMLAAQLSKLRTIAQDRLKTPDSCLQSTMVVIRGLPEQDAEDGQALQHALDAELMQAAQHWGFTSDAIIEVKRLGNRDAERDPGTPRAVQIRCRTAADRHRAFKAQPALKSRGIFLEEYLTPAQIKLRRARMPALKKLLHQPGTRPHFRGAQLHYWRNGQCVAYVEDRHGQPLQLSKAAVADRLAAIEARQQHDEPPAEEFSTQIEEINMLSAQLDRLFASLRDMREAEYTHARAANMVIYGLPEEEAEDDKALLQAVDAQLVQPAGQQGLTSDAVLEAKRLGASKSGSGQPRPVLVRCRTAGDKQLAFQAQTVLKTKGIILRHDMTQAQMRAAQRQKSD